MWVCLDIAIGRGWARGSGQFRVGLALLFQLAGGGGFLRGAFGGFGVGAGDGCAAAFASRLFAGYGLVAGPAGIFLFRCHGIRRAFGSAGEAALADCVDGIEKAGGNFSGDAISGAEFEADGASGVGGIDGPAVLGDEDAACGDETPGSGAGRFHQGRPVLGGGGGDLFCGFGGADGLARGANGEE
jgi:hypothetical protein